MITWLKCDAVGFWNRRVYTQQDVMLPSTDIECAFTLAAGIRSVKVLTITLPDKWVHTEIPAVLDELIYQDDVYDVSAVHVESTGKIRVVATRPWR